jgi:hypothetical protein
MNRISRYEDMVAEYERSMSRVRFHQRPLNSSGKWIFGKIVYGLYLAMRFALYIWYYDFFIPWRDH